MYWLTGVSPCHLRSWASSKVLSKAMNLQAGPRQRHHVHRGDLLELGLQDRARGLGHGCVVEPHEVALDQRGGRQVGEQPQRVRVGHELHVAVALLPRGDGVAVDRVHVDVHGQQVVAALGARLQGDVEEVAAVQPLALEPALHVGEREHDGVDLVRLDQGCAGCFQRQVAVVGCAHGRSPVGGVRDRSVGVRDAHPSGSKQRCGVVAVLLHHLPGAIAAPRQDRLHDPGVLGVGVSDVRLEDRDGAEHLVQRRLHGGDGLDHARRAAERGDGEVEPGVRLSMHRRPAGVRDRLVGGLQSLALIVVEALPGRQCCRAGLDDPTEVEGVDPSATPRRRTP